MIDRENACFALRSGLNLGMRSKSRSLPDLLNQINGLHLSLDDTLRDPSKIAGAEIHDGTYRIFTVPLEA